MDRSVGLKVTGSATTALNVQCGRAAASKGEEYEEREGSPSDSADQLADDGKCSEGDWTLCHLF